MLGCKSVPYCFWVTLTLTSGISPILLAGRNPKLSVSIHLGVAEFIYHFDLDLWSYL